MEKTKIEENQIEENQIEENQTEENQLEGNQLGKEHQNVGISKAIELREKELKKQRFNILESNRQQKCTHYYKVKI